jgi:hypothetical protein
VSPRDSQVTSRAAATDRLLLRGLRFPGEEVQLSRVLAAIAQEAPVAKSLVSGILELASGGNRKLVRQLLPVPNDVSCLDERILRVAAGRSGARRRSTDAGRVDLDFASRSRWRVLVELKINSAFGRGQLARYATTNVPLVVILRDSAKVPKAPANPKWLGSVGWSSLLPTLRSLPIASTSVRDQWQALLAVMEADGDEVKDAARILEAVATSLEPELRRLLTNKYGRGGTTFAARLRFGSVFSKGRTWAGFGVKLRSSSDDLFWIALRNLWSRRPRLRVWWHAPPDPWARNKLKEPHKRIARLGFVEQIKADYLWDEPLPDEAIENQGVEGAVLSDVSRLIRGLIRAGVLDVDVAREI